MKQVGPIHMSSERPTSVNCLREVGRLIQRDHRPTCVSTAQKLQVAEKDAPVVSTKRPVDEGGVSRNANDVLMLRTKPKRLEECDVITNESVLETEKERDKLYKELDLIDVHLQGKKACTCWRQKRKGTRCTRN